MKILIAALCLLPTLAFAQLAQRTPTPLSAYSTTGGVAVNILPPGSSANECTVVAGATALVIDPTGAAAPTAPAASAIPVAPAATWRCGQMQNTSVSVNCVSGGCTWTGYRQ